MPNSNLAVFRFNDSQVRFVDDKPVANDVAAILGYKNTSDAVYRLVKEKNKGICRIQTPGGMQSVTVLEEPGIYQLIFSSKLESAETFQDWVFSEVLPSIRKTGTYGIIESRQLPTDFLSALKLLVANEEELMAAKAKIASDAPLVAFAETIQATDEAIDFNTFAKMIGTGRTRLFRQMRDAGVIMKNSCLPYQKWMDAEYFEVSQEILENGKLVPFALVTGKGQLWLKQRLDAFQAKQNAMARAIIESALS